MGWFPLEALELQTGKPGGLGRAFLLEAKREDLLMILLLVKLRSLFGRLTALIVWTRKSQR